MTDDSRGHTRHPSGNRDSRDDRRRHSPAATRAPRLVASLAFSVLTLLCALFALGVIAVPTQQVEGLRDAADNAYTGNLRSNDGEFIGPVRIAFSNGDSYEGELDEGRFSGEGSFADADGWALSGTFEAGRLTGAGVHHDATGSYEDSFTDSLPTGTGTYHPTEE
jgi:hypothetical protein